MEISPVQVFSGGGAHNTPTMLMTATTTYHLTRRAWLRSLLVRHQKKDGKITFVPHTFMNAAGEQSA